MSFRPESTDLASVARELVRAFSSDTPRGYLLGRTALRDAVTRLLGCSQLEAEGVVETMIGRGFLRYEGSPSQEVDELSAWRIVDEPGSR